jgi:Flp pilus assembly protein TadG
MNETAKPGRPTLLARLRDRRGIAMIEAAFVLPPLLSMLFLIIELGVYFVLQSALDLGVLTTAETLRTNMAVGRTYTTPTASAVKAAIASNGGAVMAVANLAVDVRQLSTLSAAATPVVDGTYDWGGSGSVLILRAQTTMPLLPGTSLLTLVSTSIVRRPPY